MKKAKKPSVVERVEDLERNLALGMDDLYARLKQREAENSLIPTWRTEVKQITVELQNMERRFDGMRDELKSRDGLSGRLAGLLQRVDSLDRQIDNVAVAVSRLMQPEPKPRRRWVVPWDGVWHRIAW